MKLFKHPLPTIYLIILVFVVPMLIAVYTFRHHDTFGKTVNYGELILPPKQLSKLTLLQNGGQTVDQQKLYGQWWLVYVGTNSCDKACKQGLYNIRQVRQATGKNKGRIERAIITPVGHLNGRLAKMLEGPYQGTRHFEIKTDTLSLQTGSIYIIDPHGNIMMRYGSDTNPRGMLKDMEKLLKVSQIG